MRRPVAITGATGMVGKCFAQLLERHPWFEIVALAASQRSAGKTYGECVEGDHWPLDAPPPTSLFGLTVLDAANIDAIKATGALMVFSAIALNKQDTAALEESYASAGLFVVSNNSAHRGTPDVPMVIPEINHDHLAVLPAQRKRLGTSGGGIVVKPNCSLQSYVPMLAPLRPFGIQRVFVSTYQAASGAGRNLTEWPELNGNVIPYIGGEEEKSEQEPLKIFGTVEGDVISPCDWLSINATCIRVAVQHGHLAVVNVTFENVINAMEAITSWKQWAPLPQQLSLPSAPSPFIRYCEELDRPQPALDVMNGNGMTITVGRVKATGQTLRFIGCSHNLVRGAAGGGVLNAELCVQQGYA